jgi:hypothetical protein
MARYRVSTPVPGANDKIGDVVFTDGVALVDEDADAAVLAYCRGAGYSVELADEQTVEAEEPAGEESAATPKKSASTEAWRAWAVEHGGMSAEEAETLSRDQLVERFTSTEETLA